MCSTPGSGLITRKFSVVALACLTMVAPAFDQRGESPRDGVNSGFDRKAPKVGERLPNLSMYDEMGEVFKLRSLKENYTVLVFGCLT